MGWVFDKELGVKRVPDEAPARKPDPVTFNGVDCNLLAARYVAHRKAQALAVPPPEQRDDSGASPGA